MSKLTRTDVTAVKFFKNIFLAGVGSTINIFHKESAKLIQRLQVLHAQKVYGFVPSPKEDIILVFGGKQFTVVSCTYPVDKNTHINKINILSKLFEPVVCDDWLHSAVWINDDIVALLTAHNVVQKWNIKTQSMLSQHRSKDNSILYSGLLISLQDDVLVMAGTVFSEVIIHKCDGPPLHHLKGHRGVIFSISCEPKNDIIVTTSDDRSVRIWGSYTKPKHAHDTVAYWENIDIVCKHKIYGHLARVMRSCITNDLIVSVGEDSAICYWSYEGKLLKKTLSHQNGCIWSVDSDGKYLLTGGGDCGVSLHPLTIVSDYGINEVLDIGVTTPNKVTFTARRNLFILDKESLVYYDILSKNKQVHVLNHESTYKFLSLSNCKQLIAVADMAGKLDVFIETCKDESLIINMIDTKLNFGKILSMHWAGNRHLVFCSENGNVTVLASNNKTVEVYSNFMLPSRKENSLTACAVDSSSNIFLFGDRSGYIHVFVKGQINPIKSFHKVHGRYGPTSIHFRNKEIITTGRDGTIKYFSFNDNIVKCMTSKDLPFQWVEKFLDKNDNMICGFQERVFVVYDVRDNNKILEVPCGGGHRSWDAVRYIDKVEDNYEEFITLVYLKNSDINMKTFQLSKIVSKDIINGSHAKEINCLATLKVNDVIVYMFGGEDTTLRISSADKDMNFKDEVCFKHLSSVRTVKTYPLDADRLLVLSAGGRAQICIRDIEFTKEEDRVRVITEELANHVIIGADKDKNHSWKNHTINYDIVMRIMDAVILKDKDEFIIFAGCSDSALRVFLLKEKKLELIHETQYHNTCILKTAHFSILNRDILITCTTRGDVTFWDVTDIKKVSLEPFFTTKTNKSGINSIVIKTIGENKILVITGGDDNAIHAVLFEIPDQDNLTSIKVLHTWDCANYHSSQITGLCLVEDCLLSTSIDQRVTLLKWKVVKDRVEVEFQSQTYTDVPDVQGMNILEYDRETITVCVFGKGMEVIVIPRNDT